MGLQGFLLMDFRNGWHENPCLWGRSGIVRRTEVVVRHSGDRSVVAFVDVQLRGSFGIVRGSFGIVHGRLWIVWQSFGVRSKIFRKSFEIVFEHVSIFF